VNPALAHPRGSTAIFESGLRTKSRLIEARNGQQHAMGDEQSTKESLGRDGMVNIASSEGKPHRTATTQLNIMKKSTCRLALLLAQPLWMLAETPKPDIAHPTHEDLTAKECLAAARLERNAQNWPKAIVYYRQLELEFNKAEVQEPEPLTYLLELLDCLLKSTNYEDSILLIERIQKIRPLQPTLSCELTFIKGECLYRLKKYSRARQFLSVLLAQPPLNHPSIQQIQDRGFLMIAESLLEENLNEDAVDHLSRNTPHDPAIQSMAAALKARAFLRLHQPEKASQTLAASAAAMASHNISASRDSLLLQTALQFCQTQETRKALHCILLTRHPERNIQSLRSQLIQTKAKIVASQKLPDSKNLNQLTKQEALLKNEIQVATAQSAALSDAILATATSLASESSAREAFILLKYFAELRILQPNGAMEPHQKLMLGCLLKMERWDEAKNLAQRLETELTDSKEQLETQLLKGIAISKTNDPSSAISVLKYVASKSTDPEFTARAKTLCACTQLETGDYAGAVETANSVSKSLPTSQLSDTAQYLIVAASIALKEPVKAVAAADKYLKDKTKTENRELVEFYRATALLALNDPLIANDALRAYIDHNPKGEKIHAARLLLGESLLSIGKTLQGISSLQTIPASADNLHDEAQLKIARALILNGQPTEAEEALVRFLKHTPQSPRIADACRDLLKLSQSNHTSETARYRIRCLLEHKPNECRNRCADTIIGLLSNADEDGAGAANNVHEIQTGSGSPNDDGLCSCSIAKIWATWRNSIDTNDAESEHKFSILEQAASSHRSAVSEKILFEIASHCAKKKTPDKSLAAWRELLRWYPCTMYKDRALLQAGLAEIELGRNTDALRYFARLEAECHESLLFPKMLMTRSEIHRNRNEIEKCLGDLMRITASKCAPIHIRSRALLEVGEHKINNSQYGEALVYLQRVTLTALSQREMVARAYERMGFAFEKLGRQDAANEAYTELLSNPDLEHTSAASDYKSRTRIAPLTDM
jgi:outer membrane protein assembly factor BamD (BamD/ComL family)